MMNKKVFFALSLLSILFFLSSCGGGGSGGDMSAPSTNPGVPSVIKLMDVQNIVQVGATVYLKAKVLDGNGNPLQNIGVTFTNISTPAFGVLSATGAMTDDKGIATVTLNSSVPGFATIAVSLSSAAGTIRDKTTVYFDTTPPATANQASLTLDVDSNNNGVFDESSDFIMLDPTTKTDALIRATVTDSTGARMLNSAVTFGSDSPEVTFPAGSSVTAPVVHTNADGQASVVAKVSPTILTSNATTVNITASAVISSTLTIPAVITLQLKPVTISSVVVGASPTSVASAGSSTITATVTTSAGTPAAGTMVSFTTSGGGITGFAVTNEFGAATATLNAPTVTSDTSVTVTATTGGKSGSTSVLVTAPVVTPEPPAAPTLTASSSLTVDGNAGGTVSFTISGGKTSPSYSASSPVTAVFNDNGAGVGGVAGDGSREAGEVGIWTGATFTATIESCTPAQTVTITATDGATPVTAIITIVNGAGTTAADRPTISPTTFTIFENITVPDNKDYAVKQGAAASLTTLTGTASNAIIAIAPASQGAAPGATVNFNVSAADSSISVDTTYNLLFVNDLGCKAGATVKVTNE